LAVIDMGQIEMPEALSKEEFERRNFPGATLRDIDPALCQWFEETAPLYPFKALWRCLLRAMGIKPRRKKNPRLDT